MLNEQAIRAEFHHQFCVTRHALAPENGVLDRVIGDGRAVVFIDDRLDAAQPRLRQSVRNMLSDDRHAGTHLVPGGERCKNDVTVYLDLARRIADAGIDRQSYVIAIGGGAVLDVVGFAAATVHRGVRLVRLGSTTLAQADSAMGVKNGINLDGVKNMLGCFAVPAAVINDATLLTTLSDTDWRGGFAEAVKVALIKDATLFSLVERHVGSINERDLDVAELIITRSAELHFDHITTGGDPFEQGSARPLDVGHWSAHRLETMTGFELSHGDAVAIGLAIDTVYAARLGVLRDNDARRILRCLCELGFVLSHPALDDTTALLAGLEQFREHLGGPLTLILPAGLGETATVHTVDEKLMIDAIQRVADGARTAV